MSNRHSCCRDNLIGISVAAIISAILALSFAKAGFPYADSGFWQLAHRPERFLKIVHFFSNAVFSWRVNPLVLKVPYDWAMVGAAIFFGVGAFLLIVNRVGLVEAWIEVGLLLFVLLGVFGYDTMVWFSLSFFPLHLFFAREVLSTDNPRKCYWIGFVFLSLLLAESSNQLSLLLVTLSLVLAGLFRGPSCCLKKLVVFVGFAPAIFFVFAASYLELPIYPADAHVVPAVGTIVGFWPNIGPAVNYQIINQGAIRDALSWSAPIFVVLALAALGSWRRNGRNKEGHEVVLSATMLLVLGVSLCWAGHWLSPEIQQIGPLATLRRIVPGLNFLPFEIVVLALCLFLVVILTVEGEGRGQRILFLGGMLAAAFLVADPHSEILPRLRNPLDLAPILDAGASSGCSREQAMNKVFSPSYYVVKNFKQGDSLCGVPKASGRFEPLPRDVVVSASSNGQLIGNVSDGKLDTRWYPAVSGQHGDEWIRLNFLNPREVKGLELDLGIFTSDFPRGVEVLASENCEPAGGDFSNYDQIYSGNPWQGNISVTEEGFPFFGPQHEVRLIFSDVVTAKCLLVRQLGVEPNFDWSVAEIALELQ